MKTDIHPDYMDCEVRCGCGERFTTRATTATIRVEVCSKCHPFYTGKQKLVDSAGRVEKFQKRWGKHMEERRAAIAGSPAADPQAADEPAEATEPAEADESAEATEPAEAAEPAEPAEPAAQADESTAEEQEPAQ